LLSINLKMVSITSYTVFINSYLLSYEFHSSSYFVFRMIVFLCCKNIELFVYPLLTCGSELSVSWKRGIQCISIAFMWQVVRCDNNDIRTTRLPSFPNQKLLSHKQMARWMNILKYSDDNVNTNRWSTIIS